MFMTKIDVQGVHQVDLSCTGLIFHCESVVTVG